MSMHYETAVKTTAAKWIEENYRILAKPSREFARALTIDYAAAALYYNDACEAGDDTMATKWDTFCTGIMDAILANTALPAPNVSEEPEDFTLAGQLRRASRAYVVQHTTTKFSVYLLTTNKITGKPQLDVLWPHYEWRKGSTQSFLPKGESGAMYAIGMRAGKDFHYIYRSGYGYSKLDDIARALRALRGDNPADREAFPVESLAGWIPSAN